MRWSTVRCAMFVIVLASGSLSAEPVQDLHRPGSLSAASHVLEQIGALCGMTPDVWKKKRPQSSGCRAESHLVVALPEVQQLPAVRHPPPQEMEPLLTALVIWLSESFGLPADFTHPVIMFVPPERMALVRYQKLLESSRPAAADDHAGEIVAFYDDLTRTLHVPAGWTGTTSAELSVIVHEMVHHLQNVGGLTYGCAEEREKLAFLAQERWLEMSGSSLLEAFGIDALTLKVRTTCGF